ncbi:MAG: hypothetical protein L6R40_005225 [Gallowayella cf. fulva]|nr:MAG: hypothetical protein L6R40_005225 [Xanthomendoza cf. fulva]
MFASYDEATKSDWGSLSFILQGFKADPKIYEALTIRSITALPMTLGLSVISTTHTTTSPNTRSAALIWADALRAAPAVVTAMWPPSPLNSQQLDLTSGTPLPNPPTPSVILNRGLSTLMSDLPTFLAFNGLGRFVVPGKATVPFTEKGADLAVGVNTFLTSKLLKSQGFYAIPRAVIDEQTWAAARAKDAHCLSGPATCVTQDGKVLYRSPTTGREYEFKSKNKKTPLTAVEWRWMGGWGSSF